MTNNELFSRGELRGYVDHVISTAVDRVGRATAPNIRENPEKVVGDIVSSAAFVPVDFDFTQITRSEPIEVTIEGRQFDETYRVAGQAFDFHVPVTGSAELLEYRASTFSLSGNPRASVSGASLTFRVEAQDLDAETARAQVAAMQARIVETTGWTNAELGQANERLLSSVRTEVFARKQRLDDAAATAESLDIPTKR